MWPLDDSCGSAFHSLRETVRLPASSLALLVTLLFISNSFWPTQSPPGLGGRRVVTKPLNGTEAGSGRSASQWRGIRHSPPPATKIPEEPIFVAGWFWTSPLFSPRGEAKCVRSPSVQGARRSAPHFFNNAAYLNPTLSTASKRNAVMAGLLRASTVRWCEWPNSGKPAMRYTFT